MTAMPPRTERSDSIRNRVAILTAAHEQITAHGPEIAMSDIAAAAGVAVGTLYRHFPTKADLVAAVLSRLVTQMADRVDAARDAIASGADPGTELQRFLTDTIEAAAVNHAVKAAAHALDASTVAGDDEHRAVTAMNTILNAAKAARTIRHDLTVDDIYLIVATAPVDQSPSQRRRWLELICTGINS